MAEPTVCWLISTEKPPEPATFLSPTELQALAEKRFPKRRAEWLNGRWAAKRLLRASHRQLTNVPFQQIEIVNTTQGVPYAIVNGQVMQGSLSISHRDQGAFCAVIHEPSYFVGADIERVEPRSSAFIIDYFTVSETRYICDRATERHLLATLMWSAKEAMLKALGQGLRLDTRQVEVLGISGTGEDWCALEVHCPLVQNDLWITRWRRWSDYVLTLAVRAEKGSPSHKDIRFIACV